MARTITARLRAAMQAQETGEVLQTVCEIAHASIVDGPLRVVSDLQDFTSDGKTYTAFPFRVTLPASAEDGRGRLRLVLDSVDRRVLQAIRQIPPGDPPTVKVDLILASEPDQVQISFPELKLRNVTYDVFTVEGEIAVHEDDREPAPAMTFSPATFPGLF